MKKFVEAEVLELDVNKTENGCWFFHHEGEQVKGCFTGHVYYETQLGPVQEQPGQVEPGTDDDFTNSNS